MTTKLRAHFDGKVLVPEEAVDLPKGQSLEILVTDTPSRDSSAPTTLEALAEWASNLPEEPGAPEDGAAQHDHYLYRAVKRT